MIWMISCHSLMRWTHLSSVQNPACLIMQIGSCDCEGQYQRPTRPGLPRGGIESHELGSVHGWGRKLHVITSTAGRVIMWSPQHGKPRSFPPQGGLLGWPRKWGSMVDFAHRFQIRERSQGSSEVGIGVNVSKVGWCLFSTDHKSLGPSPQSPSPPKIATCRFEL